MLDFNPLSTSADIEKRGVPERREKRFKLPYRRATRPAKEPMVPEGPHPINIHCPTTSTISVFLCKTCLDRQKRPPYTPTHQKKCLINNYQSTAEQMT
jgi:hypothetical protein